MSQSTSPQKILVVEDSPVQAVFLKRLLIAKGYDAIIAKDGRKGLESAIESRPDLIVSDIRMPEMNGYEMCSAVRENPEIRNTPVLMLTELSDPRDIVFALKAGADNYVTKPFDEESLFSKIEGLLAKPYVFEEDGQHSKREIIFEGETHEVSADPQRVLNLLLSTYDNVVRQNRELVNTQEQLRVLNEQLEQMAAQLKSENLRMGAELEVTQRLQQMVLPKESELAQVDDLEISAFMQPATEVGGDYYDVLQHDGHVRIGIGDVTGHGLESGVLMLMVQVAIRTLMNVDIQDPVRFLSVINQTIYDNLQRTGSDKNLTLSLLDYSDGLFRLSGQHESVLVIRNSGEVERIETIDLGFPVGLDNDISDYVNELEIRLSPGEGIVLYTDGVTEAGDMQENLYGLDRLCKVVSENWGLSVNEIQQAVVADVKAHIGEQEVYDDITLLVIKQK
jgi:sigma-B regulation protein RsbU (phosphoserine phosphatase)